MSQMNPKIILFRCVKMESEGPEDKVGKYFIYRIYYKLWKVQDIKQNKHGGFFQVRVKANQKTHCK